MARKKKEITTAECLAHAEALQEKLQQLYFEKKHQGLYSTIVDSESIIRALKKL